MTEADLKALIARYRHIKEADEVLGNLIDTLHLQDEALARTAMLFSVVLLISFGIPDDPLAGFFATVAKEAPVNRASMVVLGDSLTMIKIAREAVASGKNVLAFLAEYAQRLEAEA